MDGANQNSFLSRPPKLSPVVSLALGAACVAPGVAIRDSLGGGLVGGGAGLVLMGLWDIGRLRYVAWRQPKAEAAPPGSRETERNEMD